MLKQISVKQLNQLKSILNQINDLDYAKPLSVIQNATIGKHVRHILEFYECLFNSSTENQVCYDDRKRNLLLEENVRVANECIIDVIEQIKLIDCNNRILLISKYENTEVLMESSLYREITYNIEHTVHHLAIIRIAISNELNYINVDEGFGFADSTINYLQSQKVAT